MKGNIPGLMDLRARLDGFLKGRSTGPALSEERIFAAYKKICYSWGRFLDRQPHDSTAQLLYRADVEMTPGIFLSLWITTVVLASAIAIILSLIVFWAPFSPFSVDDPLLYILILTVVAGAVTGGAFPFYLQNKISNKKLDIEKKIPYALAFMSILASSGATPLDIIRRVVQEDYGHISREFAKVLFRVDVLGEDAVTAMNDLVANTPSEIFRAICIDLTNIMYGGGGLKEYLSMKSKDLMSIRRQTYKEFVESLAVFAEGYLGGIVMVITLAVLGIIISGALSIKLGPFSSSDLLFYLIYLVTPLVNVVFLQVLSVKYSTNP